MSEKEKIIQLLDCVSEEKLGYILAYIQGISIGDLSDDMYCKMLYDDYLDSTEPDKDTEISLEDYKAKWGIV